MRSWLGSQMSLSDFIIAGGNLKVENRHSKRFDNAERIIRKHSFTEHQIINAEATDGMPVKEICRELCRVSSRRVSQ